MNNFIKVQDPSLAEQLAKLGFSYIKESDCFAFLYDKELAKFFGDKFSEFPAVCESKLRF